MKKLLFLLPVYALVSCGNSESYQDSEDTTSILQNQISADTFMTKENSDINRDSIKK
ncbi:hypothetical protein WG906_12515 [Pedobacter sp. P351]|uniref:hypothetical protein n=1 Tax=Pedobacter superstes TaxID=3133441 RepID=UPI0030B2F286